MVDCKENFKFDLEVKGLNIVHAVQYSIEAFTTSGRNASVRDKLVQLDLKIQENATARIWTSKFPSVSPDLLSKRRPSNQTELPWSPCFLNHSFVPNCIELLLRCKLSWTSNSPGGYHIPVVISCYRKQDIRSNQLCWSLAARANLSITLF